MLNPIPGVKRRFWEVDPDNLIAGPCAITAKFHAGAYNTFWWESQRTAVAYEALEDGTIIKQSTLFATEKAAYDYCIEQVTEEIHTMGKRLEDLEWRRDGVAQREQRKSEATK